MYYIFILFLIEEKCDKKIIACRWEKKGVLCFSHHSCENIWLTRSLFSYSILLLYTYKKYIKCVQITNTIIKFSFTTYIFRFRIFYLKGRYFARNRIFYVENFIFHLCAFCKYLPIFESLYSSWRKMFIFIFAFGLEDLFSILKSSLIQLNFA